jgi:tRNA(Ile)-lysidine synthetase-like protein
VRDDLSDLRRHAGRDARAWDRALELVPELKLEVREGQFAVARQVLGDYDNALSVALLRAAARRAGYALGPTRARRLLALARRPSGRRLPLGDGWSGEVAFDRLRVSRNAGAPAPGHSLERVLPAGERGSARFGDFEISWAPEPAPPRLERATWTTWVADGNWELRPPASGDAIVPLGGVGHRPLRRLLMEARVPRSARPTYPVVARGETILWVPGICRSADALPVPGTRAVRLDVTECG